jgi:hypothetical protein
MAAAAAAEKDGSDPYTFLRSLQFRIDSEKNPVVYRVTTSDGQQRDLITVIAYDTLSQSVYWRQVFYKSTGSATKMAGTWFPLSAIIPGKAGFVKKDYVNVDHFKVFDRVYKPSDPLDENDIRVRMKTLSFLLASNQLNSAHMPNIVKALMKSVDEETQTLLEDLNTDILRTTADMFAEDIPTTTDHSKTLILGDDSSEMNPSDPYKIINRWIGTDNYAGIPAIRQLDDYFRNNSNSLLPKLRGGGRKKRTRRTKRGRRATKRRRH